MLLALQVFFLDLLLLFLESSVSAILTRGHLDYLLDYEIFPHKTFILSGEGETALVSEAIFKFQNEKGI